MPVVQPYFDIQPPVWENFFSSYMNAYLGRREPLMDAEYKRRMASMDPMERMKLKIRLQEQKAKLEGQRAQLAMTETAGRYNVAKAIITGEYGLAREQARGETARAVESSRARASMAIAEFRAEHEAALAGVTETEQENALDNAAEVFSAALDQAVGKSPEMAAKIVNAAKVQYQKSLEGVVNTANPGQQGALTDYASQTLGIQAARHFDPDQSEALASSMTGVSPSTAGTPDMQQAYAKARAGAGSAGPTADVMAGLEERYPGIQGLAMAPERRGFSVSGTAPQPGVQPDSAPPAVASADPTARYVRAPGAPAVPTAAGMAPSLVEMETNQLLQDLGQMGEGQPRSEGDKPWDYYLRDTFGPKDPGAEERTQRMLWLMQNRPTEWESLVNQWTAAKPGRARAAARGIERTQDLIARGEAAEYGPGGSPAMPAVNPTQVAYGFGPESYPDFDMASAAFTEQMQTSDMDDIDKMIAFEEFSQSWKGREQEIAGERERESALAAVPVADAPAAAGVPESARGLPVETFAPGGPYGDFTAAAEALASVMDARKVPFEQQAAETERLAGLWGTTIPSAALQPQAPGEMETVPGRLDAMERSRAFWSSVPEQFPSVWESVLGGPGAVADYAAPREGETPEQHAARQRAAIEMIATRQVASGITGTSGGMLPQPSMDREPTAMEIETVARIPDVEPQEPMAPAEAAVMARQSEQPVAIPERKPKPARKEFEPSEEMVAAAVERFGPDNYPTALEAMAAATEWAKKAKIKRPLGDRLLETWEKRWPQAEWNARATAERAAMEGAADRRVDRESASEEDRYLRGFTEGAVAEDVGTVPFSADKPGVVEGYGGMENYAKAFSEMAQTYKKGKEAEAMAITGEPDRQEADEAQMESVAAAAPMPEKKKKAKKKKAEPAKKKPEDEAELDVYRAAGGGGSAERYVR